MRLSRTEKRVMALGVILLGVAIGLSRVQLDRRASVVVGLLEVAISALVGIFLGVSAVRKDRDSQ